MVLVTIVTGVVSQKDMKTLGRISFRIMAYYIVTTLVACAIGILVTSIVKPGAIANFTGLASKEVTGSADITVADFFTGMFSSNITQTFADGNILQTVVIAILLGVAILRMKNPEHKEKAIKGMNVLNDMVFSLINMIMLVSPIGVFFLMGDSFGKYGAGIFTSMATLVGTYYLACLVHVVLVYCTVIWVTAGINPLKFLKDSAELVGIHHLHLLQCGTVRLCYPVYQPDHRRSCHPGNHGENHPDVGHSFHWRRRYPRKRYRKASGHGNCIWPAYRDCGNHSCVLPPV